MVWSAMDAGACGVDALATRCAGVQAVGQDVQGANQQLPEGRAYEAAGDGQEGQTLRHMGEVDFVHGM